MTNLSLVRMTLRSREVAVRTALGASPWRLVRQFLTESLLLSFAGGALGLALASWGMRRLIDLAGAQIPRAHEVSLDWRVFAYISVVALGSGIVVGLIPALRASRTDLNEVLRECGRSMAEGNRRQRGRSVLIVAQVAVSLVLLVAAGLFVRSVQRAQPVDFGFDP